MPTYTAPGVYVEEIPSTQKVLASAPTAVAAFVGFTERAPLDDPNDPQGLAPRLVTSWNQFESLYGGFVEGAVLPLSVYGYFLNGGSLAYIVRVPNAEPSGEPARLALPAADRSLGLPISVESVEPDADLTVVVETSDVADDHDGPAPFSITIVDGGEAVESYDDLTLGGPRDAATVINKTSTRVKVEVKLADDVDLKSQLELLKPGAYAPGEGRRQAGPGQRPQVRRVRVRPHRHRRPGDRRGRDDRAGPGPGHRRHQGGRHRSTWASGRPCRRRLIAHCEQHANRMAILDAPPGLSPQAVKEWRTDTAQYDSAFATLYYPWIKVENPTGSNGNAEVLIPPSGHVAGVWARTDETRGVWKAPANDTIRGVLDVERSITQAEQGVLNPIGHQRIRPFGQRGIRIWGARTLTSDTDWTLHQRPPAVQHDRGDDPRGHPVGRVRAQRRGPVGGRQAHAQRVPAWAVVGRCPVRRQRGPGVLRQVRRRRPTRRSRSTQGKLVVEVGIAPVKPAEFVIFRISQNKQIAS